MEKQLGKIVIIIMFAILGFFITFQIMNLEGNYNYVSSKTMADLENSVKREKEEISNIKEIIRNNKNKLVEYDAAINDGGSIKDVLKKENYNLKLISGFIDIEGPGVIIKLSDSERELYEWENPNSLIVHDQDVLRIINDLKVAGAEAISINGQRLMSYSEIQCAGATITINNHTYGQPFIIKAIGELDTLSASVKSRESYASILKEVYDLQVEVETSEYVKIAKYNEDIYWKYITPKEGE